MSDPLDDLVNDIRKSRAPRNHTQQVHDFYARGVPTDAQQRAGFRTANEARASAGIPPRHNGVTVAKGEGGLMFNFGPLTGNPIADRATVLLNHHSDPTQAQIARYQRESITKAMHNFVVTGHDPVPDAQEGVHPEWNQQFSKSLDQQVVDAIKSGQIPVTEGNTPGGTPQHVQGEFNKSQLQLQGETVIAQSETDAAVIEMMKSMPQADPDEVVIDASEK